MGGEPLREQRARAQDRERGDRRLRDEGERRADAATDGGLRGIEWSRMYDVSGGIDWADRNDWADGSDGRDRNNRSERADRPDRCWRCDWSSRTHGSARHPG